MNYGIVFRLVSAVLTAVTVAFCLSLFVGYFEAQRLGQSIRVERWLICIAVGAICSGLLYFKTRKASSQMFRKEALAVIGLGWILASLLGALPYFLVIPDFRLADAIFESTSGLTTTGASILTDVDALPPGIDFWRCISQWFGGLGVVVFFVAILSFLGAGAKILYSHEASATSAELDSSRIQDGVLKIFGVYLGLSFLCLLTYRTLGMDWFDAACHMFTTVATGGFSTHTASIGHFGDPRIEWACILFMILGGTSFLVILKLLRFSRGDKRTYSEVYAYFTLLVVCTLIVTFSLVYSHKVEDVGEALRQAAFQVTSIMTSTGYATEDFDLWPAMPKVLLMCLMVVGGCSGSTAGGMKVVRMVLALKITKLHIEKAFHPRVVKPIKMNGRVLDETSENQAVHYLVLAGILCFATYLLVGFMEPGLSSEGVASVTISTVFNIGPGFHEIGPAKNYGFMQDHTKIFLSLIMIMGRLEFYAVLALFMPALWKRFS